MSSAKNWNEAHIQGIDALAVVDAAWAQGGAALLDQVHAFSWRSANTFLSPALAPLGRRSGIISAIHILFASSSSRELWVVPRNTM